MGGFSVLAFVSGDLTKGGIGPAKFTSLDPLMFSEISATVGEISISGMRFRFDVSSNDLRGKTNLVNPANSQCFDGSLGTMTSSVFVGTSPTDVVKVDAGAVGNYFVAVKLQETVGVNTTGYWGLVGSSDDVTYSTIVSGGFFGGSSGGTFVARVCAVVNNIRYLKVRGWGSGIMMGVYELAAWRLV